MATNEYKGDEIHIADDVLEIIAGIAISKVEGVVEMMGTSVVGNIAERMGRRRDLAKGVSVSRSEEGDEVYVSAGVTVRYGVKIHEVCQNVQKAVRDAIKNMTGLEVSSVKVNVQNVKVEEETESTE